MKLLLRFLLSFLLLTQVAFADKDAAREALEAEDYKTAIKELTPLAEDGDVWAMQRLAVIYGSKANEYHNFETAFTWVKKAAEEGQDPIASYRLGIMYMVGQGTEENQPLAKKHLEFAAEQHVVNAMELLARLAFAETPPNHELARKWLETYYNLEKSGGLQRSLGEVNKPIINIALADMAMKGLGGPVNVDLAMEILSAYILHPIPSLQNYYANVKFDPEYPDYYNPYEALAWGVIAIANGSEAAVELVDQKLETLSDKEIELGLRKLINYYAQSHRAAKVNAEGSDTGSSVVFGMSQPIEDPEKIRDWFESAAERNIPHANYLTGVIWMDGINLAANIDTAKKYFERALQNNNSKASDWLHKIAMHNVDGLNVRDKFDKNHALYSGAQVDYKNVDREIISELAKYHVNDTAHDGHVARAMEYLTSSAAYYADADAQAEIVRLYVENGEDENLIERTFVISYAHMHQINTGNESRGHVADFLKTVSDEEKQTSYGNIREFISDQPASKTGDGPIKSFSDAEKWLDTRDTYKQDMDRLIEEGRTEQ